MSDPFIILAAGLGTRFGGPKQLVPVGPHNEPLFVVTARSALDAGFGPVFIVTRSALANQVAELVAVHLVGRPVEIVLQDASGPIRDKPWGTAHAVAVCAPLVSGSFGLANADDFYGEGSIAILAATTEHLGAGEAVVVGYRLGETMSPRGTVNRALCRIDPTGRVVSIEECCGLRAVNGSVVDGRGERHSPDSIVSMNLMRLGFDAAGRLAERFEDFAAAHMGDTEEFVLADELSEMIGTRRLVVHHVAGVGPWAGLTYPEDLEDLRRVVADAQTPAAPPDPSPR